MNLVSKHILCALVLLSGSLISTQETPSASSIVLPNHSTLEDIISLVAQKKQERHLEFAFDIHDVILHPKAKKQITTLLKSPDRYHLLKFVTNLTLTKHAVNSVFSMIGGVFNRMLSRPAPAVKIENFLEPLKNYTDIPLHNLLIDLANSLEVDRGVESIIKDLSQAGYPVRVASNINETVFIHLKQKLVAEKITVFSWFAKNTNNSEGKVVKMRGICKPNPQYFAEYSQEYSPLNNKLFIFIDDRKENVQVAVDNGSFIGIVFSSAQQLKSDLQTLGLL